MTAAARGRRGEKCSRVVGDLVTRASLCHFLQPPVVSWSLAAEAEAETKNRLAVVAAAPLAERVETDESAVVSARPDQALDRKWLRWSGQVRTES